MDNTQIHISNSKTREFIFSLEDTTMAKIFRSFDLLETFGHALGMPHVKRIKKDLFELRIRGKQEVRLFFTFRNQTVLVFHGFIKKTMKIPSQELKAAQARLTSLDNI